MSEDFSIHSGESRTLGTVDYVLFVLMFVASASIGFYHAYMDRKKHDVHNFHLSGRKMHPIPVSMSLTATFLSALTLLGNPTEIYTHGTMFYWIVAAMLIATVCSAHIFLPVFYKMNKTSCFDYIQERFGRLTRILASCIFLLQTLMYMGFVLYAPCLAFEAVTGLSLWATMVGVGIVCTLYTTLGGMKTVIWTDSLQFTIMVAGLITVLVETSRVTGGFAQAWQVAETNGRVEFLNFSTDPRTRHSVWSVAIGGSLLWTYLYGVNQAQVQRACSLPTLKKAQLALWLNFPGLVVIISLTCMIGIVMHAFYTDCDPLKFGLISKPDQMLPLMVLDVLGTYPGLTGLFVACVFSGSLSTMSSGLNAMSAVLLEDFVKPLCLPNIQTRQQLILSKLFVIILGFGQFGIAILISQGSGLILQLAYSMFAIMSGPLLGLFVSGLIFPWTNKYGASVGLVVSLGAMVWLALSTVATQPRPITPPLPVSTTSCPWNTTETLTSANYTTNVFNETSTLSDLLSSSNTPLSFNTTVASATDADEPFVFNIYRISYQWYTGIGMFLHLTIALIVSFTTGPTKAKDIDSKLMVPLFYNLCPWLPDKYRSCLKMGVVYKPEETSEDELCNRFDINITFTGKEGKNYTPM